MSTFASRTWVTGQAQQVPNIQSRFECKITELGLTTFEQMKESKELRAWVERNINSVYVPEKLLAAWNVWPLSQDTWF